MTGKTVKLSSLAVNLTKETEGDWIPAVDIDPNVFWFVRSTNYPPFKTARDAQIAQLVQKYGDQPIPEEERAAMAGELAAEFLLLGWKGLDEDYSPDLAMQIVKDDAYRDVRGSVYLAATKVGQKQVKFVEKTAKN